MIIKANSAPELRYTPNGKAVLTIRFGIRAADKSGWMDGECAVWESEAEQLAELEPNKGAEFNVKLKYLQYRTYKGKDGSTKTIVQLVHDGVEPVMAGETRRAIKAEKSIEEEFPDLPV